MDIKYWFEFKFVDVDNKWVSFVCIDRQTEDCDIDEHITGKELRAFIEENFYGFSFEEKRRNFWIMESMKFREYARKNGVFLVSDIFRSRDPDFNKKDDMREIDIQNLPISVIIDMLRK